jgi:hypothetical protein
MVWERSRTVIAAFGIPVLTPSSAAPVTYVILASNGAARIAQP